MRIWIADCAQRLTKSGYKERFKLSLRQLLLVELFSHLVTSAILLNKCLFGTVE